ncbi:hypothetical protein ABID13_000891 [Enterocloster citroniae]|uniref:Uncharacterized protein n=1 Tax=Enterocloster citroniae TaxID=358743 RepID=A0ABV2FTD0_9FIRM
MAQPGGGGMEVFPASSLSSSGIFEPAKAFK